MDPTTNSHNRPLERHVAASNDRHSAGNTTVLLTKNLRIKSFNSTGFGQTKCAKIKSICDNADILLVQEHWLLPSQLHKITKGIDGFSGTATDTK